MAPGFEGYSKVFTQHFNGAAASELSSRLTDFDELRVAAMEEAGIKLMVLSQTGPSVQAETDERLAARRATENNDFLARQIEKHPDRFAGFAALSMHSPQAAADELTRAVD